MENAIENKEKRNEEEIENEEMKKWRRNRKWRNEEAKLIGTFMDHGAVMERSRNLYDYPKFSKKVFELLLILSLSIKIRN